LRESTVNYGRFDDASFPSRSFDPRAILPPSSSTNRRMLFHSRLPRISRTIGPRYRHVCATASYGRVFYLPSFSPPPLRRRLPFFFQGGEILFCSTSWPLFGLPITRRGLSPPFPDPELPTILLSLNRSLSLFSQLRHLFLSRAPSVLAPSRPDPSLLPTVSVYEIWFPLPSPSN